ncbi:peptide ABC transporter substrate-binding protein [Streptomyces phaeochromogenes]|uniref:Peptide ABC transporter substrate-binding protein n=1 Tax=Streptomyces phaeochromogenes TaxID=1923 RepID=A0ABZ1H6F7_STRPH|nr:peptide ABC transporter substrate-binding protein [Streptomyces phaeochromogenes]MCX5600799.1 peptide ABC transporter substrate-binding protein [Streptomyces phaeochromogenes]WSD14100.1 peptide ABC transporter substrate-binding protein [Streptomyces phaeochromogenes]WSJ08960.1 peptide ABC transporter substrate-binding protein [Streptomyces phaeochromogenes]
MSPARTTLVACAVVSAGTLLLAGCSGTNDTSSASPDSINYALPANFTPNWILPIGTAAHLNTNNRSIADSLWERLVAYDGSTGKIAWNKKASIATAADFAADGKSVKVTLGDRSWSDGKPITSRDVEFWFNLIKANKAEWAGYNPGKAPDNWTSFKTVDDRHFTITFDKAYNSQWMLANQFSEITPLPQHVWDRTDASAKVSDADRTAAGAKKVWTYLNSAAKNISRYDKDTLWKTISGPYAVKSFATSGKVVLAANKKYDGGEKANIATVNLLPFTTADAEKNALRSGSVDYGYIEATDLDQKDRFTAQGYTVKPWSGWAITYMPYNFNNPAMGAVFKQLYARQAVQRSIDQTSLAKVIFNGTAVPGYGPVPQAQASDFVSQVQKDNPYPFSTSAAKSLLTGHGWQEKGGVMVCTDPGTGDAQCGEGVAEGTKFEMQVLSQSGSAVTDNMMSSIQSSLEKTGIKFSIKTAPVNSVLSQTPQCTSGQPICKWQLSFFGTAGSWYFNAFPTGDSLFQTKGGSNFGNYSNPDVDKLITASTTSSSSQEVQDYSAALAKDLPVIWLPAPDYQISVVKNGLGGFSQDSLANFHPAQWKWTK